MTVEYAFFFFVGATEDGLVTIRLSEGVWSEDTEVQQKLLSRYRDNGLDHVVDLKAARATGQRAPGIVTIMRTSGPITRWRKPDEATIAFWASRQDEFNVGSFGGVVYADLGDEFNFVGSDGELYLDFGAAFLVIHDASSTSLDYDVRFKRCDEWTCQALPCGVKLEPEPVPPWRSGLLVPEPIDKIRAPALCQRRSIRPYEVIGEWSTQHPVWLGDSETLRFTRYEFVGATEDERVTIRIATVYRDYGSRSEQLDETDYVVDLRQARATGQRRPEKTPIWAKPDEDRIQFRGGSADASNFVGPDGELYLKAPHSFVVIHDATPERLDYEVVRARKEGPIDWPVPCDADPKPVPTPPAK